MHGGVSEENRVLLVFWNIAGNEFTKYRLPDNLNLEPWNVWNKMT